MDTKYMEKAAEFEAGTAGADPEFWARQDRVLAILDEVEQIDQVKAAVAVQPISYIAFMLNQQAESLTAMADRMPKHLPTTMPTKVRERAALLTSIAERVRAA